MNRTSASSSGRSRTEARFEKNVVDRVEERLERLAEAGDGGGGHARKLTVPEPRRPGWRIGKGMASSDATLVQRLRGDRSGDELRELYRRYAPRAVRIRDERARGPRARGGGGAGRLRPAVAACEGLRQAARERPHVAVRDRPQPDHRRPPARRGAAPAGDDENALEGVAEVDAALDQAVLRWQVTAALARLSPAASRGDPAGALRRTDDARDRGARPACRSAP